jgi:phosphoribosylformylglycinamidine synthase subunit PurSL
MADIHEIRVFENESDPHAHAIKRQAAQQGLEIDLETNRVFYIEGISDSEAESLAELLCDPNTQSFEIGSRGDWENQKRVEVAPLPGVTNPETESIVYGANLLGVSPTAVESGTEYSFKDVPTEKVEDVVGSLLVNEHVEMVRRKAPENLVISGETGPINVVPVRELDDAGLQKLSKDMKIALSLDEMKAIQNKARELGRDLRDCEYEYLGAAWSEHCCHKTTNAAIITKEGQEKPSIFSRIKDSSRPYFEEREILSAFGDNSGVIRFYDGMAFNIKLETHNSPRMIGPEGGAATGTGGVLRDINQTGLGARPINSMHMDFIAAPDTPLEDIPPGTLPPKPLLLGAVKGVGGYGNPMGVPTNQGSVHTHPNYRGKASILVGSMGFLPEKNAEQGHPEAGDLVVAVGGRTGIDGIHGATFSSESADATTAKVHSGAVQIGAPITEKKMFDAILEASEKGLIRAMTDCGAAGFASAVGEMGEDIGVKIDLANAPLKYSGLNPWEIFLSESQERAVLAVAPEHETEVQAIFAKHNSEATTLGTFGSGGHEARLEVFHDGNPLVDLDYDFIKNGRGKETRVAHWEPLGLEDKMPKLTDIETAMHKVLSNWNVCSKEPIVRQYDHEVQGMSAIKSYGGVHGDGPNNAAVMTPILGEPYALIQSHGCNPTLTELDPKNGSVWSYVEAMSNFVATGGNPDDAVIVNNYISATPTERVMGALDMSVDALTECVKEFRSPIISGKDSLSSTYKYADGTTLEAPYNLIITVAGKIPDVEKTVSTDIKMPGSTLVLIGKQDLEAMGGSVYDDEFDGYSEAVPKIDIKEFHKTASDLYSAIQTGKVLAAHDVSEGGVAVAVSEMLFGGDCGALLELRDDQENGARNKLFNETAGCFVVEVANDEVAQELFGDIHHQIIGQTMPAKELVIHDRMVEPFSSQMPAPTCINLDELKKSWKRPMEEVFA